MGEECDNKGLWPSLEMDETIAFIGYNADIYFDVFNVKVERHSSIMVQGQVYYGTKYVLICISATEHFDLFFNTIVSNVHLNPHVLFLTFMRRYVVFN